MTNENEKLKELLYDIGKAVEKQATENAPLDTGDLKNDIQIFDDNINNLSISIGNSTAVEYAKFVHEGTGIYGAKKRRITPTKKKALKTPFGLRKSIKGQKAQPYLEDALQEVVNSGQMDRMLANYADDLGEDIFKSIEESLSALKK